MREILFRGKRVGDGVWVYGSYVEQYGATEIYLPDGVDRECGFDHYHILPESVGQYTGQTDKNGTKIFEGDILEYKYWFRDGGYKPLRAEVVADAKSFGAYHTVFGFCAYIECGVAWEHCEVVGNIYDNPELLKRSDVE